MFNKIDVSTWNRKQIYEFFMNEDQGCFSITANIDITAFRKKIKSNNAKFFPNLLFGISSVLNKRMEFKMAQDEFGNLGYYDVIHPCYTVFHKEQEMFTLLWTEFSNDFQVFLQNYNDDNLEYANKPFEQKELSKKNIFHISAMPWLSFTSARLSMQSHKENLIPMFTIGKYFEDNGKILLPFAIHANHAVLDGFHVGRLYEELELYFNNY